MVETGDGALSASRLTAGRTFFAATLIGIGIIGLVHGNFTPTWAGVPRSFPGRPLVAYACAVISLATGLGLFWRRTAVGASRVLLGAFISWLIVVRLPRIVIAPSVLDSWWGSGDTAVMTAAALVAFAWSTGTEDTRAVRVARVLYGLAMIPFGVAHFLNLGDTASLVPSWLPSHAGVAALTGAAFLATAAAVLTGVYARLAATLSVVQMGLFTLIVWVPTVVAGPTAFQWSEFVDSWALTAAGWMVADSYRGVPWLAIRGSR